MSKAEESAIKHCCLKCKNNNDCGLKLISHGHDCIECNFYAKGYQQAEKDLELTWEDVKAIFLLVQVEWSPNKNEEEIYQEVLKRFKSYGKKKI